MKKNKSLITWLLILLFVVGAGFIFYLNGKSEFFKKISYKEFMNKYSNKESFALVVEQEGCSHCLQYTPKIKKFASDNKLTVYYVMTNEFSKSESTEFDKLFKISGTPVTLFIDKGRENSMVRIEGNVAKGKIESSFKTAGFVK